MKIHEFFAKIAHKIKVHKQRKRPFYFDYDNGAKRYGTQSENAVYMALCLEFPESSVYRNVCVNEVEGLGEVDFIVIHHSNVFVIELKSWKGEIYQDGDNFIQIKNSHGDIFRKDMKSPFRQINGNVYHLKERFPNIWFHKIVLFLGSDCVRLQHSDCIVCTEINQVIDAVKNGDRPNNYCDLDRFIKNIHSYDIAFSSSSYVYKFRCIIKSTDLEFTVNGDQIHKKDVKSILIKHHYSYDDVILNLNSGNIISLKEQNKVVECVKEGKSYSLPFSRIDRIEML